MNYYLFRQNVLRSTHDRSLCKYASVDEEDVLHGKTKKSIIS